MGNNSKEWYRAGRWLWRVVEYLRERRTSIVRSITESGLHRGADRSGVQRPEEERSRVCRWEKMDFSGVKTGV